MRLLIQVNSASFAPHFLQVYLITEKQFTKQKSLSTQIQLINGILLLHLDVRALANLKHLAMGTATVARRPAP
jgi:hypothetical protein